MTFNMFNYFNVVFNYESDTIQLFCRTKEPNEAGDHPETLLATFTKTQDIDTIDRIIKYEISRFEKGIYDFVLVGVDTENFICRFDDEWIER